MVKNAGKIEDGSDDMIQLTTLYELTRQIKQAGKELEDLKRDPAASHDEIAEVDALLTRHKIQYAERVAAL